MAATITSPSRPTEASSTFKVDEEPIARLEPLSGTTYGLSFHQHSGRWEPTPFTGDLDCLERVLTTEFGAYLDACDFPPMKSGADH
jgi:hypothetical protein